MFRHKTFASEFGTATPRTFQAVTCLMTGRSTVLTCSLDIFGDDFFLCRFLPILLLLFMIIVVVNLEIFLREE